MVRYQVKSIQEVLADVEKRLRVLDTRVDKAELTDQRVSVLASMLSPTERDKAAREIATIRAELTTALNDVTTLKKCIMVRTPV